MPVDPMQLQSPLVVQQHDVRSSSSSQAGRPGPRNARRCCRSTNHFQAVINRHAARQSCRNSRWATVNRKPLVAALISQHAIQKNQQIEIKRLRAILGEKERTVRGLTMQQARWVLDEFAPVEGAEKKGINPLKSLFRCALERKMFANKRAFFPRNCSLQSDRLVGNIFLTIFQTLPAIIRVWWVNDQDLPPHHARLSQ